jgi:hypothetical protein
MRGADVVCARTARARWVGEVCGEHVEVTSAPAWVAPAKKTNQLGLIASMTQLNRLQAVNYATPQEGTLSLSGCPGVNPRINPGWPGVHRVMVARLKPTYGPDSQRQY